MFVLIDWEDGYATDLPMTAILEPRKEFFDYKVGDKIFGRCPGYKGKHPGTIAAIDTDRTWLRSVLGDVRPVPPKSARKNERNDNANIDHPAKEGKTDQKLPSYHEQAKRPSVSAKKPNTSAKKPSTLINKRNTSAKETNTSTQQPNTSAEKPNTSAQQSNTSTKKPNQSAQQPSTSAQQSRTSAQQPNTSAQQPRTSQQPNTSTKTPNNANKKKITKRKLSDMRNGAADSNEEDNVPSESEETEQVSANEVKLAKIHIKKSKKEKEVEKKTAMIEFSKDVTSSSLEQKIDTLTNTVKGLVNAQFALKTEVENLMNASKCLKCVKIMYKAVKTNTVSENQKQRYDARKSPVVDTDNTEKMPTVATSTSASTDETENEETVREEQVTNEVENTIGLQFIGDAKFGVKVDGCKLQRAEAAANNAVKLALNILELLVTKQECNNLSMYGFGKNKEAMEINKRRALRSHIFNKFQTEESNQEAVWAEIVSKLNDKIRGIKNGKYKLED